MQNNDIQVNHTSDTPWQRIVVKVGSALIAPNRQGCSSQYLLSIANFIVRCRMKGIEVILVSSGSVAAGSHKFQKTDKASMTLKKAMAATGQSEMMATWDRLFDFATAQLLLTHADLKDRARFISIRDTVNELLHHQILPVINENDAVTTDKLKVGDNDNLSAMVASAANADALIICSDINGLYDKNPSTNSDAKLITDVHHIDESVYAMAGGAVSAVGTGGMKTKLQAAEKAVSHGIDTFIVNGFTGHSFNQLLAGNNPGTHFHPYQQPMQDHAHWMRHATREQGEIVVKDQVNLATNAIHKDLSPQDLMGVVGEFDAGDTVMLRRQDGNKLAKVKTNYSSCLLRFVVKQDDDVLSNSLNDIDAPLLSEKFVAVID
jgi:glutamate 5-kinase